MGCSSSSPVSSSSSSGEGVPASSRRRVGPSELDSGKGDSERAPVLLQRTATNAGGVFMPESRRSRRSLETAASGKYSVAFRGEEGEEEGTKGVVRVPNAASEVVGRSTSIDSGDPRPFSHPPAPGRVQRQQSRLLAQHHHMQRTKNATSPAAAAAVSPSNNSSEERPAPARRSRSRAALSRGQSRSLLKRMGSSALTPQGSSNSSRRTSNKPSPMPSPGRSNAGAPALAAPSGAEEGADTNRSSLSAASSLVPELRLDRLPGQAGQAHREARKQEEVDAQKKIHRQQSRGFTMIKEFQKRQQSKSGGLSLQQQQQGGADMG